MSSAVRIFCIIGLAVLAGGVDAQQSVQPPKKAPIVRPVALFVGSGNAGWLPKTALLPSAQDVENLGQKLGSRLRNIGPFGLPTFPTEEDIASAQSAISRPTEKVTLSQALLTLKVTGINLKRKEFLIGARNVFQGDTLELSFRDQIFVAEVIEVSASQILFRDRKREETGVLMLTLIPHLVLEPLQNRPGEARLEGKITPMEPIKTQRP